GGVDRPVCSWVGDASCRSFVAHALQVTELCPAPRSNTTSQLPGEIAEEGKRFARSPFLTHEEQRRGRRNEQNAKGGTHRIGGRSLYQSISKRPVSDLVVVLQEGDERARAQVGGGLAARSAAATRGRLAPKRQTLGQPDP